MPGRDTTGPQGMDQGSGWGMDDCNIGQNRVQDRRQKRNQAQNRGNNLCRRNRGQSQRFRKGPWNR